MPRERDFYFFDPDFEEKKRELQKILYDTDISALAREVTEEALREMQDIESAIGHFVEPEFDTTMTTIDAAVEDGTIKAGEEHVILHRFGELRDGEKLGPIADLGLVVISYDPRRVQTEFLPTIVRRPLIDIHGRSNPTRFLLTVPESQVGKRGDISIDVIAGGRVVQSQRYHFKVV